MYRHTCYMLERNASCFYINMDSFKTISLTIEFYLIFVVVVVVVVVFLFFYFLNAFLGQKFPSKLKRLNENNESIDNFSQSINE